MSQAEVPDDFLRHLSLILPKDGNISVSISVKKRTNEGIKSTVTPQCPPATVTLQYPPATVTLQYPPPTVTLQYPPPTGTIQYPPPTVTLQYPPTVTPLPERPSQLLGKPSEHAMKANDSAVRGRTFSLSEPQCSRPNCCANSRQMQERNQSSHSTSHRSALTGEKVEKPSSSSLAIPLPGPTPTFQPTNLANNCDNQYSERTEKTQYSVRETVCEPKWEQRNEWLESQRRRDEKKQRNQQDARRILVETAKCTAYLNTNSDDDSFREQRMERWLQQALKAPPFYDDIFSERMIRSVAGSSRER